MYLLSVSVSVSEFGLHGAVCLTEHPLCKTSGANILTATPLSLYQGIFKAVEYAVSFREAEIQV